MATPETRSTRGAELLGLVAFAVALMLLIALATFDPRDPAPFFKAGVDGPARNFIGPFGAFLAEMLIPQLFGVAAMLLPLVLGLLGWKLFWCKPIDAPYTKAIGNLLLLLSLAGLFALVFGTVSFEGEPVRAGGAIGEILAALARGGLQPHRRLHRRRDVPLRGPHPVDAVLVLDAPRGRGPAAGRARSGRCRPPGPTTARAGARRSCAAT